MLRSRSLLSLIASSSLGLLACVAPPAGKGGEADRSTPTAAEGADEAAASAGPNPSLPGLTSDASLDAELAAVLAAKGPDYQPRTEHLHADGRPQFTNRLIRETSPYLLQHAHNPVNWFPWGDEAFARAEAEGKPVLLSIGYSTCHWCHVMERESFENLNIAAYINANFIAIKVDREQRPDVDEVYMAAVQLLTGGGGWPMTVALTPAREPFFGGTYFPPEDRGQRPGFRTVLERLRRSYEEQPEAVVAGARELSQTLAERSTPGASEGLPEAHLIVRAAAEFGRSYDDEYGGFGFKRAPKFPRPVELDLLLRYALRSGGRQADKALAWVEGTMQGMIKGGLRDRVGGGFHRYSTDAKWLVPHFEKMLYDNAQLVLALLELHQQSGDERYAQVARETLRYLERDMRAPSMGFYSATDADSPNPESGEREEGWFFTWTPAELEAALSPEHLRAVTAFYGVSEAGNFEGRNILQQQAPLEDIAAQLELDAETLAEQIAFAHKRLFIVRSKRPRPLRDDKILTSWNGLVISAFARAAFVLDEPLYLESARSCANFLVRTHMDEQGRLLRSTLDGAPSGRAFLDDYAFLIQGLLDLFEFSGEVQWLERSLALQAQLDGLYLDPERGGYFTTAKDAPELLTRTKPSYDGAEPSGNSIAALNLLRLHEWTLEQPFRDRAELLLTALGGEAARSPISVPKLLTALDFAHGRPLQIFVVAPPGETPGSEMLAVLRRTFVPNAVRVMVGEERVPEIQGLVPALGMKLPKDGKTTAFVCERGVCQAPTTDPAVLAEQLERLRWSAPPTSANAAPTNAALGKPPASR